MFNCFCFSLSDEIFSQEMVSCFCVSLSEETCCEEMVNCFYVLLGEETFSEEMFNYRPSEMRLLYFSTVGFKIFFFFQSPTRLDLTSYCHNQYQYQKAVEVAVI